MELIEKGIKDIYDNLEINEEYENRDNIIDDNIINFDNVLYGFITVFVIVTLEGWIDIFIYVLEFFKIKFK